MAKKKNKNQVQASDSGTKKNKSGQKAMDKKFITVSDGIFLAIIVFHLCTREWPVGGQLQTIMDVCLGVAFVSLMAKYYAIFKKK